MERSEILKDIIKKLHQGATVDEVKEEFKKEFGDVPAAEIAEAEQILLQEGMPLEEVQNLCDVHATLFEGNVEVPEKPEEAGHPLFIFGAENKGFTKFLDETLEPLFKSYLNDPQLGKDRLVFALRDLSKIDTHYTRKEILFFPYLEKAGITAPPKVMWGVDDEIRGLIKAAQSSLDSNDTKGVEENLTEGLAKLRSMITKEEEILTPLLIQNIDEAGWKIIAHESPQIGYVFNGDIEGASPSDAVAWLKKGSTEPEERSGEGIQLPSGFFTVPELTHVLNALPSDITFVGADDKVHFFSEQPHRVFPRTRTIIGRDVADCHPPKSLEVVEKLVEAFKDGSKDSESFWIQRGEQFILIRYFAVRDDDGKYLGVLEATEEISSLRKLEGNKTLMG